MKTAFDEPDDEKGPALQQDTIRGTNTPMEASDAQTYTVEDTLRISWLNHHLRKAGAFKSMRDCIDRETGELDTLAVNILKPYYSYLLHEEHDVLLEDAVETKWMVDVNFGTNDAYVSLKATI